MEDMREILEAVASGDMTVEAAQAELAGYAATDAGRFDAARVTRTGVPEVILAADKTPGETGDLVSTAVETTNRAIATRVNPETARTVRERLPADHPGVSIEYQERARTLVARTAEGEPPSLAASVGVVTAGTSDAAVAGEAATVASEMGATVDRIEDVGVAALVRLVDQLDRIRDHDVLVVAAGREGALPTVVSGLVDVPVIGLPVSIGYGHGGEGEAALAGMLQSCTPLTVVNIDAGFAAGAQAGLVARTIARARE